MFYRSYFEIIFRENNSQVLVSGGRPPVEPEPLSLPGDAAPDDPGVAGIGLPSWVDEAGWAQRFGGLCEEREPEDPVTAFYDDPDVGPPPDSEQESWELLTARAKQDGAEYQELIARLAAAGHSESAHVAGGGPVPGSPEGPAAGFGQGRPLGYRRAVHRHLRAGR
jgi:hypothetical protein